MVKRIERETLHDKVYHSIKESIVKNELKPGDKLTIDSLANDLGVSPTPVREALAKLTAQGLVVSSQNKKAEVASITEEDLLEIYEVRKLLEPYSARVAAEEISDDPQLQRKLTDLKNRAEETKEAIKEKEFDEAMFERYMEVDLSLENLIEEALGDLLLHNVLRVIGDHSRRVRTYAEVSEGGQTEDIALKNTEEHLEIMSRMSSGDFDGVEDAVDVHLENAEKRTVNALSE